MIDLEKTQYKPVGYCIFCGSTKELTREHILPFALGGSSTLPKASCKMCAVETGKMEEKVLRGPLWPIRVFRDLKSRSKHKDAPKMITFTIERDGREEVLELPLEQAPLIFRFPLFSQPGLFRPDSYQKGIDLCGQITVGFGETAQEILKRLNSTRFSITQEYYYVEFARLIAKIAYCAAFSEGLFSLIKEDRPPVATAIIGQTDDIGRFVGNIDEGGTTKEGTIHHISQHVDNERQLLISHVHLFADSYAPRYAVILGSLAPGAKPVAPYS